jgi:hypothetical protein
MTTKTKAALTWWVMVLFVLGFWGAAGWLAWGWIS